VFKKLWESLRFGRVRSSVCARSDADYARFSNNSEEAIAVATDYDAPRKNDDETTSLEELKEGTQPQVHASSDMDESDGTNLLSADVEHEELDVVVVPKQEDEFTCMECFIVKHRTQMAAGKKNICTECAF
jgi:hypothetical protein